MSWNFRDNIASAAIIDRSDQSGPPPNDVEYYVYDASGQRSRKVKETWGSGVITVEEKIYLGGVEIKRKRQEGQPNTLERYTTHIMDDKQRIALSHYWTIDDNTTEVQDATWIGTNRIHYQYSNHLGSAALETDASGNIISYEEYFPYGETSFMCGRTQKEVKLKEYRYTGKERDDSTGLYYHGARYYQPWLFRWMSADPAGPVDRPNLYAYVSGNPVRMNDPTGTQEENNDEWDMTDPEPDRIESGGETSSEENQNTNNISQKKLEDIKAKQGEIEAKTKEMHELYRKSNNEKLSRDQRSEAHKKWKAARTSLKQLKNSLNTMVLGYMKQTITPFPTDTMKKLHKTNKNFIENILPKLKGPGCMACAMGNVKSLYGKNRGELGNEIISNISGESMDELMIEGERQGVASPPFEVEMKTKKEKVTGLSQNVEQTLYDIVDANGSEGVYMFGMSLWSGHSVTIAIDVDAEGNKETYWIDQQYDDNIPNKKAITGKLNKRMKVWAQDSEWIEEKRTTLIWALSPEK